MEGAFSTRLMCGAAEAGGGGDPAALVVGREARAALVADGPPPHAIGAYLRRAECRGARVGDGGSVLGDAPISEGHGEAAEARDQRREGEQKEGTHLVGKPSKRLLLVTSVFDALSWCLSTRKAVFWRGVIILTVKLY